MLNIYDTETSILIEELKVKRRLGEKLGEFARIALGFNTA